MPVFRGAVVATSNLDKLVDVPRVAMDARRVGANRTVALRIHAQTRRTLRPSAGIRHVLVLSLTVVGAFAFFGLGVDLLPNIDIPTVSVSVSNPGSSPEQIETEITKKLEGALNTISGIDELRSTSVEGRSQVTVTFLLEKDGDVAAQEVRDKVNLVIATLPEAASHPSSRNSIRTLRPSCSSSSPAHGLFRS